jgi:twitching motility two-component system response regulator PilH
MSTVLLVEDSITETELITRYLQKEGHQVVSVASAEDAQVKLKQQKPDLIVLDVILPGQSGFEFCRKIKADVDTKAIPVVICSTKNTDVDKAWGAMGGADAYVTKPVDQALFVDTIRKLIRR